MVLSLIILTVLLVYVLIVVKLRILRIFIITIIYNLNLKVMANNMFPGSQSDPDVRILENDSKRISESSESVESKVYAGKRLARFFELEISIRIFGQEIWHWIFPPKND